MSNLKGGHDWSRREVARSHFKLRVLQEEKALGYEHLLHIKKELEGEVKENSYEFAKTEAKSRRLVEN